MRYFIALAFERNLRLGKVRTSGVGETLKDEPLVILPLFEAMVPITTQQNNNVDRENIKQKVCSEEFL